MQSTQRSSRGIRKFAIAGTAFLLGMVLLVIIEKPAWECRAEIAIDNTQYPTGAMQSGYQVKTLAFGSLITTGTSGLDFTINLLGSGNYILEYSPNIYRIKVFLDKELKYEGTPARDLKGLGILRVEPQWRGDSIWLKVSDTCTLASIFKGLFR